MLARVLAKLAYVVGWTPVQPTITQKIDVVMTNSDKKKMLRWNSTLWVFAMVAPAFFSIAFASAKFPWPMVLPMLLIGPMLASNKMLSQASGDTMAQVAELMGPISTTNTAPQS